MFINEYFAILSAPRSGSNHLVSLLNSHPSIVCLGEVFRPKYNVVRKLGKEFRDWQCHDERLQNPEGFIACLIEKKWTQAQSFGVKVFYPHLNFKTSHFISTCSKVIFLERENQLARYSSNLSAKKSGQGALKVGQAKNRVDIKFNKSEFIKYLARQEDQRKYILNCLKEVPPAKIFKISYSMINNLKTQQRLLEFLGVPSAENIKLESIQKKRNINDISARFSNPDALNQFFLDFPDLQKWSIEK
jgi:hypothetical protein